MIDTNKSGSDIQKLKLHCSDFRFLVYFSYQKIKNSIKVKHFICRIRRPLWNMNMKEKKQMRRQS